MEEQYEEYSFRHDQCTKLLKAIHCKILEMKYNAKMAPIRDHFIFGNPSEFTLILQRNTNLRIHHDSYEEIESIFEQYQGYKSIELSENIPG
eukprot:100632_1